MVQDIQQPAANKRQSQANVLRRTFGQGATLLRHPLFLLLAGAVVSSLIIPTLTRRWQDHEKELELKTGLVSQINESVTSMMMSIEFAEFPLGNTSSQQEYDKAYTDWEVKRAVVGSTVQAYFPNSQLPAEWMALSTVIEDIYTLSGTRANATNRSKILDDLQAEIPTDASQMAGTYRTCGHGCGPQQVRWDVLAKYGSDGYADSWYSLRDDALAEKDMVIQHILQTPIIEF
jgi:hypothetical protein